MDVVVVGAGIVGAALADRLAAGGARVTVVDAGAPGRGTSELSLGWLNANATIDPGYFGFRVAAMRAWADLAAEFGRPSWYAPTGNLTWAETEETKAELAKRVYRLRDRGYPARLVTADEVTTIEPSLRPLPPDALAAHFAAEGYVHGSQAIQVLLGRAQRAGARVIGGCRVVGLEADGARLASGQRLRADAVVCAAGWRTNELLTDVPLVDAYAPDSPACCLIATAAAPATLRGIVQTPRVHLRTAWPGGLLLLPYDGGAGTDMTTSQAVFDDQAADLLAYVKRIFTGLDGARITTARRCVRPLPADGLPLVGWRRPGLYVAVTHSGITLAAHLARLITAEILDGADAPELAAYRPDRTASEQVL